MENNKFLKYCIKNRTFYYFDVIVKPEDFETDNILIDEKSHEITLIYEISYKIFIGRKPLLIRFDKIYRVTESYDGTTYLILFGLEKYDAVYNRNRYLISLKSSITCGFFHYYTKIKVESYDS